MKDNNYKSLYAMSLELSKKGDKDSLNKLIDAYLCVKKKGKKTIKDSLRKTKNQELLQKNIDEKMKKVSFTEEYFQLLVLGMSINRCHYLYDYLKYAFLNNIDLKLAGFYNNVLQNPLNKKEKKEVQRYIIEYKDFQIQLISLIGKEYIKEILDSVLDYISDYSVSEKLLKILSIDQEYVILLQPEIRRVLENNPHENIKIARYLNIEDNENQSFISQQYELHEIFYILRKKEKEGINSNYKLINLVIQILKKEKIDNYNWKIIEDFISKKIKIVDNIEKEDILLEFMKSLVYVDYEYIEDKLIILYKNTRLYSNKVLFTLVSIKSNYAYCEMINFMLTSENRKERYKYAVKLTMSYPEKAKSIYEYAKDLEDERLMRTLDEVAKKCDIFVESKRKAQIKRGEKVQILPHGILLSEILYELAVEINANIFYAAVGFAFSSGLKMLSPLLEYMKKKGGKVELLCGSLQNYYSDSRISKMDRRTAIYIKNIMKEFNIGLFTYEKSFYHGKFYYIGNKEKAYVVLGSSNISQTAYLKNYEFDVLIELNVGEKNIFISWYEKLKKQCISIVNLEENRFESMDWESELDIYSSQFIHKMSDSEVMSKITELTDEDIKFRLNNWMKFNPSDVMSNLGIKALDGYIVFLYADYGIAVFESFIPGNAYYTFKYYDFEQLLNQVSKLTKSEMITLSNFVNRGYHIYDKEKLKKTISDLFN